MSPYLAEFIGTTVLIYLGNHFWLYSKNKFLHFIWSKLYNF